MQRGLSAIAELLVQYMDVTGSDSCISELNYRGVARGGGARRGGGGAEWIFYGKTGFVGTSRCSVGLKYAKMRWRLWLHPRPHWRSSRCSPKPSSRLGRETPPQSAPLSALKHLDSRAFGAQLLWPQCKILATPLLNCVIYLYLIT